MKMGSSDNRTFGLVFSLVWLFSWATLASSIQDDFLQCLSHHSNYSTPITKLLYTPQNSSYSAVLDFSIKNLRFASPSTPKPQMIVTPLHVSHIQATVICAKRYGMHIRVRSGGHDFDGLSYMAEVPFVMVDLVELRSVDVDIEDGSAWVEAGATLVEVYYGIANRSRTHAFPAGVCPTVGVGGYFSGGGSGTLLRKYGLAADNIIDACIVDIKGRVLNRESMGEDLFWAIRGGGAVSFGIVSSWKIRLVPVPVTVTGFRVSRTLDQGANKLLARWQQIADKLLEDLTIRVYLQAVNGSRQGERTVRTTFESLFLGNTTQLLPLMNERFPELGLEAQDCTEMSWIESVLYYGATYGQPLELLLNRTLSKFYFASKSDYVREPIPEVGLEGIWKLYAEEDVGVPLMVLIPYGGRMSEISETEIAFPHRKGNLYLINYWLAWDGEGDDEASQRHLEWLRKLFRYMTPYVSKYPRSAYLNYRDLDLGRNKNGNTSYAQASIWGFKYFNNNFNKLVRIKIQVDPGNFFWNEQSIPSLAPWWKN